MEFKNNEEIVAHLNRSRGVEACGKEENRELGGWEVIHWGKHFISFFEQDNIYIYPSIYAV